MFDYIITPEQKKLRDEARAFTKWVPKEMILAMDREELQFPREYLQEAGRRNLLGIRLPKEYGGRGLGWVEDSMVAEEIGVASYSLACLWGVGAAIEIATKYTSRRKAFGQPIMNFQAVGFKVTDSVMMLDAESADQEDEKIYE